MHHKNCKYLVGIKITKCHYSPFSHKYDQEDTSETCTSVRLCYGLWIYLCVCLREEEMSKDFFVQGRSACAALQDFLTHKITVVERVRHVNKHVPGCVLKLETDLCSARDQLFKGRTEHVSAAE